MKLDKFLEALSYVHVRNRIPLMSLLLLHQVHEGWKKGDVTIMDIIFNNPMASQATAHKYLQVLIKKKILEVNSTADGRKKLLCIGNKYDELKNYIGSV